LLSLFRILYDTYTIFIVLALISYHVFLNRGTVAMTKDLKSILDAIYSAYHHSLYLRLDPLEYVHGFCGKGNREMAGLLCSALAYGRVEQIRKTLETIFNITGNEIIRFCEAVPLREKVEKFSRIKHRFNDGSDIAVLLECAVQARRKNGSLEALFIEGFTAKDATIEHALDRFVASLRRIAASMRRASSPAFTFLLPMPRSGSACKRLNMFLRWMVRPSDGIDLGLWTGVAASKLIMPVDTHVAAVSEYLGLTNRKSVDWKMAEEITSKIKMIYPDDPVRCDFSLCRAGMIDFRTISKAA
jgi:uncharacterized protein (TIGR02757 family)